MIRLDFLRATLLAPLLAMLPKRDVGPWKTNTFGGDGFNNASWKFAKGTHTMDCMRGKGLHHPDTLWYDFS